MSPARDERMVATAWDQGGVVLGYDIHGDPWLWPDQVRVMQGIVLGMTGSGKTTLLKNIITQDLMRRMGPPEDRHKIPMVIFDGKGDLEFFQELLPYIHRAGRLDDLRLINPARPELSSLYNPFYAEDDDYMAQVNMVFGSFNLHDEFFSKHQLNYLADIVRILHYTGVRFNFYDVIVAVLDQGVLQEQIDKARRHIRTDTSISMQRRLNFEMSVRNLMQSFEDRDRVPKIQGLLNECMTFLDDALSIITGPYDDLLSIDDVIEQELILFVTLNVNKNTEPVRALGKMLLQNIQLVVGKRYESEEERKRANRPLFSVVMDEFAPFGYQNFSQILNTARGTNTAFLFSMQSLPQLLKVGKGFKEDVTSAPNTKIALRTQDEETARYFIRASAEHAVTRRTQSLIRQQLFGFERFQKGMSATEREEREYRAEDEKIKNLPKGSDADPDDGRQQGHTAPAPARPHAAGYHTPGIRLGGVATVAPFAHRTARSQPAVQDSGIGQFRLGSQNPRCREKVRSTRRCVDIFICISRWLRWIPRHSPRPRLKIKSALPASRQQQAPVQPQLGRRKDSDQAVPAARYSPLAAQGGYSRGRTSPLEAMVHALNPRDVNLGAAWEERRRAWLENAGANRYFWYSFGATILVILSWFALAWMHNDRVRERWQLAEHAADALRYGEYCKRRAKEAIDRYNLHIETCNRVIEAGESGMATPETANLEDYKRELQRLKSDNDAKELQVTRLSEQLEQKATELNSLTERVTAAEQRLKTRSAAGSETGNAALVERIQRLEAENRRLKQRKTAAKPTATADNGSGEEEN